MAFKFHGGPDYAAQLLENYMEDRYQVFYVRPFTQELREDLDWQMEHCKLRGDKTDVEITLTKDGGYRVARKEEGSDFDFMSSMWGMLFRRFMAESKNVRIDQANSEKFYVVTFSNMPITSNIRRLAV